ncbi:hypothetical protein EWM64_g9030 [Hericium alpestre]|uniref:Uncharacterized protein n=1 Tax=Hericium alpestre TaxID=135208 RepID=A0A4Y9ZMC3_9AGAM|nr:hypothetical protein EWM64_g9030 [Hericium alpestre]
MNRGMDGPLWYSYPLDVGPLHTLVEVTLKAHGMLHNPDPMYDDVSESNGGNSVGSTLAVVSIDLVIMCSSTISAYCEPNAHCPNLLVIIDMLAERVLFVEEGVEPAAIGVMHTHA